MKSDLQRILDCSVFRGGICIKDYKEVPWLTFVFWSFYVTIFMCWAEFKSSKMALTQVRYWKKVFYKFEGLTWPASFTSTSDLWFIKQPRNWIEAFHFLCSIRWSCSLKQTLRNVLPEELLCYVWLWVAELSILNNNDRDNKNNNYHLSLTFYTWLTSHREFYNEGL
jgi:hypothetical protein